MLIGLVKTLIIMAIMPVILFLMGMGYFLGFMMFLVLDRILNFHGCLAVLVDILTILYALILLPFAAVAGVIFMVVTIIPALGITLYQRGLQIRYCYKRRNNIFKL